LLRRGIEFGRTLGEHDQGVKWRARLPHRRAQRKAPEIFDLEPPMLRQRLTDDMKTAMKAGETERRDTIRLIISAMKAADNETKDATLIGDDGIVQVMTRMVKQRRDSIDQYAKGGRQDLADKEIAEITVIEAYLPKQMDEAAAKAAIAAIITETGATGAKDMGKVMGALKAKYAGQMDFGKASGLVKELLK
jgi:uncharacterized protein